ncbi:MAG: hypothetical protein JSV85_04615 [Candidatus Bathyarchaeota archaeon]|nr:MAG: hypothetical protein JSV85_04615 [Candidatus Bathyarchaeota archaeon]
MTEEGGNKFLRSVPHTGSNYDIITMQKFPSDVKIEFLTRHSLGQLMLYIANTLEGTPGTFCFGMWINGTHYSIYYHWNDGVNYIANSSVLGTFTTQPNIWHKASMSLTGTLAEFYVNDSFVFEYDISTVIPFPVENFFLYWATWGQRGIDNVAVYRQPTIVSAAIDVDPDTLSLRSQGRWITAYIELPEGYNVSDVDVSSIKLNETFSVDPDAPTQIGDYDSDGIPDLMVKFNRTELTSYLYNILEARLDTVVLAVSGNLTDGRLFEGSEVVRTRLAGDANEDFVVDVTDLSMLGRSYGARIDESAYDARLDLMSDGVVDVRDLMLICINYGATIPE